MVVKKGSKNKIFFSGEPSEEEIKVEETVVSNVVSNTDIDPGESINIQPPPPQPPVPTNHTSHSQGTYKY